MKGYLLFVKGTALSMLPLLLKKSRAVFLSAWRRNRNAYYIDKNMEALKNG